MAIPKSIIAATDFSAPSDAAVAFAADLAHRLNAELTIVHCYEARYPYPVPLPPDVARELHEKLERRYADAGARARLGRVVFLAREGAPSTEILSLAQELGADLIVLGAHRRNEVARLLLGSVAEKVVRASPVAVALVPGPREDVAQQ